jgi:hypothetical protein
MAVPTSVTDLSTVIASNSPAGNESVGSPGKVDDYLRAHAGIIAQVNAAKANIASPTFTGHVTVEGVTATGATGTGKFVFDASPTLTGTVTLPSTTSIGNVSATEIGYLDGVTSAIQTQIGAIPTLAGGTYTPTITETTNFTSTSASVWQYMRVGSTVHASGQVTGTTGSTGAMEIGISLPVASNLAQVYELVGCGLLTATNSGQALILGDATNNRAKLNGTPGSAATHTFSCWFTYQII